MLFGQQVCLIAMAAVMLLVTLELIRRRWLREEYAILWLVTSLFLLATGVFPALLLWAAEELNLAVPTLLTLLCFLFLTGIVLQYSVVLTRQAHRQRRIIQEQALLREKLEEIAGTPADTPEGRSASGQADDGSVRR
ncbi:MAG: hypothetical protein BIFFINMI_01981 [Phycisphaerae bacterium]|nr:hypothetical protein [Phycisphaerae bacterium]